MTEKKRYPTLKNQWGKYKVAEWTNQYTNAAGKQKTSKNYGFKYSEYNVETKEYYDDGEISIDRDCDLSIIQYFIEELRARRIVEFLKDGQYSINRVAIKDKPTIFTIKKEYKDKNDVQQCQVLDLKSKRDILHFSTMLNSLIYYLSMPYIPVNNSGVDSFTSNNQNQSTNENEFVDETQDDDIQF